MADAPLEVARLHAKDSGLDMIYHQTTAEAHAQQYAGHYDVVTCMEMLEHVPEPAFCNCSMLSYAKARWCCVFSTINRNIKSYLQAIVGAEYVLKMLPKGTHQHQKFIKPSELIDMIEKHEFVVNEAQGITYNPITSQFKITPRLDVNYMLVAIKQ